MIHNFHIRVWYNLILSGLNICNTLHKNTTIGKKYTKTCELGFSLPQKQLLTMLLTIHLHLALFSPEWDSSIRKVSFLFLVENYSPQIISVSNNPK